MKRESAIFVLLLAAAAAVIYAGVSSGLPTPVLVLLFIIGAVAVAVFPRYREFREYERGVFFRLGKFDRVAGPGWVWYFPILDSFESVDLRTQVLDIPPQEVITKENIKLKIDAAAYIKVVDPKKVVIEVKDVKNAVTQLLHAEIRTVIGRMPMEEVLEKTEELNTHLHKSLVEVAENWGVKALNVEITNIEMPKGLLEATQRKQEAYEYKTKVETEAQARSMAIEILDGATKQIDDKTLAYLYLDALKKIADGKANKIIFPLELSKLASLLGNQMKLKGAEPNHKEIVEGLIAAFKEKKPETVEKAKEKKKG